MDVRVAPSKIAGTGCYAARDFKKGERIGEYTGKLTTWEDSQLEHYNESTTYLFDVGDDMIIDATDADNPLKYINHSCEPNCASQQRGKRIYIRAIRNIKAGEELSYEYNLVLGEGEDPALHACNCGMPSCRGTQLETTENI